MRWVYYDVDETIVMHYPAEYPHLPTIKIKDPYDKSVSTYAIHVKHVDWIKKMHSRGEKIVVWSASGAEWAQAVINALGIKNSVDFVLQKPDTLYDDDKQVFYAIPRWQKP